MLDIQRSEAAPSLFPHLLQEQPLTIGAFRSGMEQGMSSAVTVVSAETSPSTEAETTAPDGAKVSWLAGLNVYTAGSSVTLDVASRVFAQLGANVTSGTPIDSVDADVVLVDRIGELGGVPGVAAVSTGRYLRHVAKTNTSVWVTASAYGLDTARADAVASDLTLLASSGILGHSRIGDEWAPTVPPGDLGLKLTGYVMVVAALHAVHVRRATGDVLHVDVSAQGSVIATGLTLEMAHALADCPDEGGSARYGAPSGFFSCVDGLIYVLVLEQHQWAAFRRALSPALDSVETLVQARENTEHVNAQLAAWAATRTAEECERILQGAGVPCTQINTLDILTDRAHAAGRSLDLSGPGAPMLPAQVRLVPTEDRRSTIGLADLRVLDAGHVLAVPLGAAWLGAMGATVTKLEDPGRLDIYRRRGPFAGGVPGVNRSAYFNQLNFNKTTLDLAVGSADAELDLDAFDVVLQNLMPRRARTVGADLDSVLAAGSSTGSAKLAISSSGFGGTGEWAEYRAYGHNIHAFAGLVGATLDAKGEMGDMGTPWADPLTSVALAAWVLAWSLAAERTASVGVDISMAELTAAQIADLHGIDPAEIYRAPQIGGDFFLRALGEDGQLLAVTLRTNEEVARFEAIVGFRLPSLSTRGQLILFAGVETRLATLEDGLRAAGLPASLVFTAHELARDPFVCSTGLYQPVTSDDLGDHRITGLPWHFTGQPPARLQPAPERAHE